MNWMRLNVKNADARGYEQRRVSIGPKRSPPIPASHFFTAEKRYASLCRLIRDGLWIGAAFAAAVCMLRVYEPSETIGIQPARMTTSCS